MDKVAPGRSPSLGGTALTQAVARYLFKLMAYKDEYEVARLHSDTRFMARSLSMFEGDFKLNFHLAPPLFAKKNDKGQLVKQKYGAHMLKVFGLLARIQGPAWHRPGHLRLHRSAQDRARAHQRIPPASRKC